VAHRDVTVLEGPLTRSGRQDAALVAARAFYTDPFFEYLAPRAMPRARGLTLYCASLLANLGPNARVLTGSRDGRTVGVCAWAPPGGYPYPAVAQVRQLIGALRALYRVPPAVLNGLRYLTAIEKAHPKEPLWYLQLLATDPEHQASGVGTALLEAVLPEIDEAGLPCYLETQKEANLAYYARFAFEPVATLTPVTGGPPLWALRREPRGTSR